MKRPAPYFQGNGVAMDEGRRGTIEQRKHERIVAIMQIRYYIVDAKYAASLKTESAYKDTHVEQLQNIPMARTPLTGVTENISAGGLLLVTEEPLSMGTSVVVDITVPNLPSPLRALAEVVRSDSSEGQVVDRTLKSYRSGLKIIAINKDDMKRIENYIVEQKIKDKEKDKDKDKNKDKDKK
jgi:prolyl oligopeptidase PreP (S9A serine peptidase family)